MLSNMLNIHNYVQIRRISETSDGMGGLSTTTALTTISKCNIWQPGSSTNQISDKLTKISSHVMAMLPGEYAFTDADREVIYAGNTYKIVGRDDDVANRGELVIVGLERLT
jgi:hypothetical protein